MNKVGPDEAPDASRPPGGVQKLLYNSPSDTLVAVLARPDPPLHRVYFRRLPGAAYQPVPVQHELESQQDAHSCEREPLLFFNEMRFLEPRPVPEYMKVLFKPKQLPRDPWMANWVGIRRFNLETGEDTRVLDAVTLRVHPPYSSGWVSQLLSISGDGSGAVCVVGLAPGGLMKYAVHEVSFDNGLGRKVVDLPNTFL